MAYRLQLGGYVFKPGFAIVEDRIANVVPQQKLARADGARTIRGSLAQRIIRVSGGYARGPIGIGTLRTELDLLKAALHANAPAAMYAGRDDRYLRNVSCQNLNELYEATGYDRVVRMDLDFIAGDPFYYGVTQYTNSWVVSTTGTHQTLTPVGIEPALPLFRILVGGSGSLGAIFTIQNATTGISFTLTGAVNGGDSIVVDCMSQRVTIGGVDKTSLFDGQWIALIAGTANDMVQAYTGSATITNITTEWRARYI